MSDSKEVAAAIARSVGYCEQKLLQHGATPRGVDWNSREAQELRFSALALLLERDSAFSIVDYGCGYGALLEYLGREGWPVTYYLGYDRSTAMIDAACRVERGAAAHRFTTDRASIERLDYAVGSGIFNVRTETPVELWRQAMESTLRDMDSLARLGFAFNALTSYSDTDQMRRDLYYADPCYWFDFCKRNFSLRVALLHDYAPYDFTIIVRKT